MCFRHSVHARGAKVSRLTYKAIIKKKKIPSRNQNDKFVCLYDHYKALDKVCLYKLGNSFTAETRIIISYYYKKETFKDWSRFNKSWPKLN